jgi:hypothetical protein
MNPSTELMGFLNSRGLEVEWKLRELESRELENYKFSDLKLKDWK